MIGHIMYNLCSMSGKNHRSLLPERMLSDLSQKGQLICLHETVLFVEQVLVSGGDAFSMLVHHYPGLVHVRVFEEQTKVENDMQ